MMQLILTACLTVSSYACRELAVTIYEDMNEFQCAMTAQPRVVTWSEENPQWRVVRWRCRFDRVAGKF
jgi:hypothetical protein